MVVTVVIVRDFNQPYSLERPGNDLLVHLVARESNDSADAQTENPTKVRITTERKGHHAEAEKPANRRYTKQVAPRLIIPIAACTAESGTERKQE